MTWQTAALTFPPDFRVGAVAIVDTQKRTVTTLWQAGGEPAEMSEATKTLIAQRNLIGPDDLLGAEITNLRCSVLEGSVATHDSLPGALTIADGILYEAQSGIEPRPDVPEDLRAALTRLGNDFDMLIQQNRRAEANFSRALSDMWRNLSRPIDLPDRTAPPASGSKPDPYERLRQLVSQRPPAGDEQARREDPTGDVASAGKSQVERSDLSRLNLSTRLLNVLRGHGIHTVSQLSARSRPDLRQLNGVGPTAIAEIESALKAVGMPPLAKRRSTGAAPANPQTTGAARPAKRKPTLGYQHGIVKSYDYKKAWGWIKGDGGDRFYVRRDDLEQAGYLRVKQEVDFVGERDEKGLRARHVWPR